METHEHAEALATTARGYLAVRSASSYVARGREREGEGGGRASLLYCEHQNGGPVVLFLSPTTDISLSSGIGMGVKGDAQGLITLKRNHLGRLRFNAIARSFQQREQELFKTQRRFPIDRFNARGGTEM